jgi:hypothetical protein
MVCQVMIFLKEHFFYADFAQRNLIFFIFFQYPKPSVPIGWIKKTGFEIRKSAGKCYSSFILKS